MQPKFVAARENVVVKTETQQTFVNGLLGFITLSIYTPLEARVYCSRNNCMSCPSIWATLSTFLSINILLGSFQLFLHIDQPLSEGEIIPLAVSASRGEAALSTPEAAWWLHALTDGPPMLRNRRRPAATSSRRQLNGFSSANSFVYFASSAATSR